MFFVSINLIKPLEFSCFQIKKELKIKKKHFLAQSIKKNILQNLDESRKISKFDKNYSIKLFLIQKGTPDRRNVFSCNRSIKNYCKSFTKLLKFKIKIKAKLFGT